VSQPTIIVTGADLAQQALDLLTGYAIVYAGKAPTEEDLVALCRAHNPVAMIVRYGKVGATVMDAAPALKVISKHGSGTDTIDKVAAKARGIEVVAAVGANAAAVAEQALALLLACAKSVVALDARMHAGHWDKATHKSLELGGRTVGLVGLGAIGLRFAKMADALGMRGMGLDAFTKSLDAYVQALGRETSWHGSEANSLRCPLTNDYRGMLNGVSAPRYWDQGEGDYHDSRDFKWNNYISRYHSRHLDLMDLVAMYQPRANAPLDDLAKLMGYPGKLGMDGSAVWQAWQDGRIAEIRDYCETDVVNTYLVYLRFERMRGHLDAGAWAAEVQVVRDALARIDSPHWKQFLEAWPKV